MLIDQDGVAIRIRQHEARRPSGALVGFGHQADAGHLQLSLEFADVSELGQ